MKDILVAIDFSKGSLHALEYAIELANVSECNVIMAWVDNQTTQDLHLINESREYRDESKKSLEEIVSNYKGKLNPGKLTYKIRKGKVYEEMAAQVKQSDCGLLVTGAHGVTGYEEFWIGSNASRVVSYSPCPVITVKFNYDNNRGIRKILFPVVHTPQTIQKVHFVSQLARAHGSDINILALHTSKLKTMQKVVDNSVAKVESYLTNQGISFFSDSITTNNLTASIIRHATDLDVDLIAIMTDWQNDSSQTILGQYAQQLVNYSPVPVLSVPPVEHFNL